MLLLRPTERRARLLVLGAILVALGAGCGSPTYKIDGRVIEDDQPLKSRDKEEVTLSFARVKGDGPAVTAETRVRPDGTFAMNGPDGRGLPPGVYRVVVASGRYMDRNYKDRFAKRFGKDASPIEVTVPPLGAVVVDVTKGVITDTPN